jgi:hypothetical protein
MLALAVILLDHGYAEPANNRTFSAARQMSQAEHSSA